MKNDELGFQRSTPTAPQHLISYGQKIFAADFELSEAKGVSPVAFSLGERKLVQQSGDFNGAAGEIMHIPAIWNKVIAHFKWIYDIVCHLANRRKRLQNFPALHLCPRRVIDEPIAWPHSSERTGFPMASLGDPFPNPAADMRCGDYANPIAAPFSYIVPGKPQIR